MKKEQEKTVTIIEQDPDFKEAFKLLRQNPRIGRRRLSHILGITQYRAQKILNHIRSLGLFTEYTTEEKEFVRRENLIRRLNESSISDRELEAILKSGQNPVYRLENRPVYTIDSDEITIIVLGDTHIGHRKFVPEWWDFLLEVADKENASFILHTGDILEGMSNRPGHVYELDRIGFQQQKDLAVELFNKSPLPIKAITGNHDGWYMIKSDMGANVGRTIETEVDQFEFLGDQEADIEINGIKIKLWHGLDGSSYATSYRSQKFIESLGEQDLPNVLLCGHAHKAIYHQCRGVHVYESGTLQRQTAWMRGKKLPAHNGFWILKINQPDNYLKITNSFISL